MGGILGGQVRLMGRNVSQYNPSSHLKYSMTLTPGLLPFASCSQSHPSSRTLPLSPNVLPAASLAQHLSLYLFCPMLLASHPSSYIYRTSLPTLCLPPYTLSPGSSPCRCQLCIFHPCTAYPRSYPTFLAWELFLSPDV